jgi:hypothetical protein
VAGKDMPSLEVRAGRGGRPPLSSRDRELGRDGSSGAILLTKRLPCKRGALFDVAASPPPFVLSTNGRRRGRRRYIWRVAVGVEGSYTRGST